MDELIEIHWTSGSLDEARKLSRYLVQEKLVACAQIIPWIESVFLWNDQLDTSQESKVVFKTLRTHFDSVRKVIEDNSQYEVPEITATPLVECNDSYREWLSNSLSTVTS